MKFYRLVRIDFKKITYLEKGNPRQRKAFKFLTESRIMDILAHFNPLLAGTIPINIDVQGSDLDIICCWQNKLDFISVIEKHFADQQKFEIKETIIDHQETVIANFFTADFEIEIFGQNVPSDRHAAFRHMLVEYQLLLEKGEIFRNAVAELKRSGMKTEPAFARLLGISGNPYAALLALETERPATND